MKYHFSLILTFLLVTVNLSFSQDKKPNYGNTPDEMVPYSNYREPYVEFFTEPQLFTGPGREKKPPTGLKSIRIGFLGPMEGREEHLGLQMLQGATLAMEEANENGGYRGIPYELLIHNDVGLWGAAANEIVRMDDEGVWAILGSIDGVVTHVALRVALKLEIPMVNTGDPDPTLTETRIPWIIRVVGDDRQSSYALANYMFREKDFKRAAVLRINNRYGRVGSAEFRDSARRLGYPLVLEVRYSEGDTTFSDQLNRVQQANADALMLWVDESSSASQIVHEMNQMNLDIPVFSSDRIVTGDFIEKAGSLSEGIVSTYPYNPTLNDTKLTTFNQEYNRRFKMEPDMFAAHAYDGMNIIIEAIKEVGLNRVLIRDVLTDMDSFQGYKGVTGEIIFDASWNDIGKIWMAQIENGEFVFYPATQEMPSKPGSQSGNINDK